MFLNNVTNLHQLTSHNTDHAPQHGDRIVTIDYCDVTSPCVLLFSRCQTTATLCGGL